MGNFLGGSAWAMVRDIAEGYVLMTERTVKRYNRGDIDQLIFEVDRRLRDLRGEQPPLDDTSALQLRNRRIQRLNAALRLLRSAKFGRRG